MRLAFPIKRAGGTFLNDASYALDILGYSKLVNVSVWYGRMDLDKPIPDGDGGKKLRVSLFTKFEEERGNLAIFTREPAVDRYQRFLCSTRQHPLPTRIEGALIQKGNHYRMNKITEETERTKEFRMTHIPSKGSSRTVGHIRIDIEFVFKDFVHSF